MFIDFFAYPARVHDPEAGNKKMKNLYIKTFGCQMNVYDSQKMADLLSVHGWSQIESPEHADFIILNTCHIREKAAEKVYSDLGRLNILKQKRKKETGKDTAIAVAGCVAQAEGAEIIKRAPYVDMVMGPQTYHRLPEMVARMERAKTGGKPTAIVDTDFPVESKFDYLPEETQVRTGTAFLSIQEGCDKFCAFCVVPYTRGAEVSRPFDAVMREAENLVKNGALELNLLGQNVNAYHGERSGGKEVSLGRLLFELTEKLAPMGLKRLRYTTSHPRDMHDELYKAHAEIDILMPYLHLPVQAGSDRILEAMNRKHTSDDYRRIIDKLKTARPDLAMASDFIVGFPGESEKDFAETLRLVRDVNYAQAYSFKYSPRPGTPASISDLQISEDVKARRLDDLQSLLNEQQYGFNKKFMGQTMPVIFEKHLKKSNQLWGRSPFMQAVTVPGNPRLVGKMMDVRITHAGPNSLVGELVLNEQDLTIGDVA